MEGKKCLSNKIRNHITLKLNAVTGLQSGDQDSILGKRPPSVGTNECWGGHLSKI